MACSTLGASQGDSSHKRVGDKAGESAAGVRRLTPAERCAYRCTSRLEETLAFLGGLRTSWPGIVLGSFGVSALGRELPYAVVSRDGVVNPDQAHGAGQSVVLLVAGIHGGEIDGKDALLQLLAELAAGERRELLEGLTLVVVPVFNVDGHEQISLHNRPNQDGPIEGMGFRTTATGHDLNRDFLKLDTPEARALVGLVNQWQPHLVFDLHTTNGVEHGWLVTYLAPESPAIAKPLADWIARGLQRVEAEARSRQLPIGPYLDPVSASDPLQGFETRLPEPRYLVTYLALRNIPSLLVESHAHRSFQERVLGVHAFLVAWLQEVVRSGRELVAAVASSRFEAVARGQRTAPPARAVLRWGRGVPDRLRVPLGVFERRLSVATGHDVVHYRAGIYEEREVPWWHGHIAEVDVERPRGYLLEPGWRELEDRLVVHGLVLHRLSHEVVLEVETIRMEEPRFARNSYQGRVRVEAQAIRTVESRQFPPGSLWIPATQPNFEIAIQLMEPEAPDSFFQWGLLSSNLEVKEWISEERLSLWAAERLASDAALAARWQAALKDSEFAKDSRKRYLWWFRLHPAWPVAAGRLPYARVMKVPAVLP